MRNLKLTLAYDGADFSGWQVQPGQPTVQGLLADAIARVTGEHLLPQGSGRTDAGVHALAQVASCALQSPIPLPNLVVALNDVLPAAVRVLTVEEAPPGFHARASAKRKTYRYRIARSAVCPPFLARYVYHHPWPLDEVRMGAAATMLCGEHDFTSFAAVDPDRKVRSAGLHDVALASSPAVVGASSPATQTRSELASGTTTNLRTIFASRFERSDDELTYEVCGSGFLHHMVRNLVGTLLLVGKGTLAPDDIPRILAARNRSANPGATAPASGLYLVNVEYD